MDLSLLLTVPGEWLISLWNPSYRAMQAEAQAADPSLFAQGTEAHADLAISLGIAFWIVMVPVLLLALRRMRPRAHGFGKGLGTFVRRIAAGGTWRQMAGTVWRVAWRAQMVHLALFVLAPLLWLALRFVLFAVFMPFSVMSFADQSGPGSASSALSHLDRPACWTFVSRCNSPSAYFHRDRADCQSNDDCSKAPIRLDDRWLATWKVAWLVMTALWIVVWRVRLKSKRRRGRPEDRDRRPLGPHS